MVTFKRYNNRLIKLIDTVDIMYGYMYNHYATDNIANTSINNWRVPSKTDWDNLLNYVASQGYPNNNGLNSAGNALRSRRQINTPLTNYNTTAHPRWSEDNDRYGLDIFNFNAIPAGIRSGDVFVALGQTNLIRSTTLNDIGAYCAIFGFNDDNLVIADDDKNIGGSIRCVRDFVGNESTLSDGQQTTTYIGNDGKSYRTVKIGNQIWVASHLAETLNDDNSPIPEVTNGIIWDSLTTGARSSYQNNESMWVFKTIKGSLLMG